MVEMEAKGVKRGVMRENIFEISHSKVIFCIW